MRSRGASKLRVITSARSDLALGTGFVFSMISSFRLRDARGGGGFEIFIEPVETLAPEMPIEIEPCRRRSQTFLIQAAAPELAAALPADQGGRFQYAQMPRNRRQGNREGARQFRHRRF